MRRSVEENDMNSHRRSRTMRLIAMIVTLSLVMTAMAGLAPVSLQAVSLQVISLLELKVVSQHVLLDSGATSVTVPITVNADNNRKVASAAFSLDYDATCLQYDSLSFAGIDGDFETRVNHEITDTDGELDIAIWDQETPKAALEAPSTIAAVTFTVLPACQVDGSTPVNFAKEPAPSLGNPGGQAMEFAPVNGTVTIDWNRTAKTILLKPATIVENGSAGAQVGVVDSDDPDGANDSYVFSLVAGEGDADNRAFKLDGTTLVANASFNFEAKKDYTVRIQVDDGKGGIFAQAIAVTIDDVNEQPTALTLDVSTIVEDAPAGALVATVSVSDPDNGDAFGKDDTFMLALSGEDAVYFVVDDMQIKVAPGGLPSFELRSSYKFEITVTDNAGGIYGFSNKYQQTVTIAVVNHVELNIQRVLATPRPPLWTTMGAELVVPVNFQAKGNKVVELYFVVDYDEKCLSYAGVKGPGVEGSSDGDVVTIKARTGEPFADGDLFMIIFKADGACEKSKDLTDPVQPLQFAKASASDGSLDLPIYTYSGDAYVIPNDYRGDCNSDGNVDAADFTAIALEYFDDADSRKTDDGYWLLAWNVYGDESLFRGSPRGCDAESAADVSASFIEVADILCTVNVVFGDSACTVPQDGRALHTATPASLILTAVEGANTVDVTVNLASDNRAAGAAFSLVYDPAQMVIDPTDANQDGIPDAIVIEGPAEFLKLAQVSYLNDQVDFALVDTTAPLSTLADGLLVNVRFTRISAGTPKLTVANVSVGNDTAVTMPVEVEYGQGLAQAVSRVFLPTVRR